MASTLQFDSFSQSNIRERAALSEPASSGDASIELDSNQGFTAGDILYVGDLSRSTCEKAVISDVYDTTGVLVDPLEHDHLSYAPVTSVLGDQIRIYRAANVDDTVPANGSFAALATREIDPDQTSTYYNDSTGSSSYWYRSTYYNVDTSAETSLDEFDAFRGDDYDHYVSLREIRAEAGFDGAVNLKDSLVDQHRRSAESVVDSGLSAHYAIPFSKPVPEIVRTIVIKLAAGYLLASAYGRDANKESKVKEAWVLIKSIQEGDSSVGTAEDNDADVSGWPDATTEGDRLFSIGDEY